MKKYLILIGLSLFLFSCTDEEVATDNNTPQYEEFSNIDEDTLVEAVDNQQNNSIYNLTADNLNSYLINDNQTAIFSFKTNSGKTLTLFTDSEQNYLAYRFGKPEKVEFRYPLEVDKNSWQNFTFEKFTTDDKKLMQIYFINVDYKYTIYYEKNLQTNDEIAGVKVKPINSTEITDIKADVSTIVGSLSYFENCTKINK